VTDMEDMFDDGCSLEQSPPHWYGLGLGRKSDFT
jgi:hypothetical protein